MKKMGMMERRREGRWHQAGSVLAKILAAVYVGGAYGLILISLVQVYILVSWFRQ